MSTPSPENASEIIPPFALVENDAAVGADANDAVYPDQVAQYIVDRRARMIGSNMYPTKLFEALRSIRDRKELPNLSLEQATLLEAARERVRSIPVSLRTIYTGLCRAKDVEPDFDAGVGFDTFAQNLRQ